MISAAGSRLNIIRRTTWIESTQRLWTAISELRRALLKQLENSSELLADFWKRVSKQRLLFLLGFFEMRLLGLIMKVLPRSVNGKPLLIKQVLNFQKQFHVF